MNPLTVSNELSNYFVSVANRVVENNDKPLNINVLDIQHFLSVNPLSIL